MLSERWQAVLRQPGALPALPEVLTRLRASLYDLDLDMDQLCAELEREPVLVGEIVKTINSPLFGVSRRVGSVRQAVVMLGLRRVRAIILSQSLRNSLAAYRSPAFALLNWWDRSILNAVTAASLCQRAAPELVEEAYLAGLVADLGILVLARFEPAYERVLRAHASGAGEDLCQVSQEAIGTDHCELAAAIFDDWKFPTRVVQAVRRHHDPAIVADPQAASLPRAVYFACLLTDCLVTERTDLCQRLADIAVERMFISADELSVFFAACLGRYREVAVSFGHGALVGRGVPPPLARPA